MEGGATEETHFNHLFTCRYDPDILKALVSIKTAKASGEILRCFALICKL